MKTKGNRTTSPNPFGFKAVLPHPMLFGMVHVRALPGTPCSQLGIGDIVAIAASEAEAYQRAGFDGIILENMHDRPYLKGAVGPEITAAMTAIGVKVRHMVGADFPIGIQILAGANYEALAVAQAATLDFIRAEGFIFGHVADEGWIEGCAGALLRERKRLGAERVKIWTDIQKKHSAHAVTSDLSLADWAHGAEFFGADALIVTGSRTGSPADEKHLFEVKEAVSLPVAIGSGITPKNASRFSKADAWIIGSSVKKGGDWANAIDEGALVDMVEARNRLK